MARVLVADDDPAVRTLFCRYLAMDGHSVLEAQTGPAALELFEQRQPDLILLDLRMPGMDGLEVLKQIVAQTRDTPILMISGTGCIGDAVQALHAGAWDYLVKPLEGLAVLQHAIGKALERQRLLREVRQYQERLEERARQLQMLASQLATAEHRERRRVAHILHEHFQQLLASAKFSICALRMHLPKDSVQPLLAQAEEAINESIRVSRSLTVELCPPVLYDLGLAAALEWLGRWMLDKHGLQVEVHADAQADPQTDDIAIMLFLCVRELLINVANHAKVGQAAVQMARKGDDQVELLVADRGVGFDATRHEHGNGAAGGFGLFSIRERIEVAGGRMGVESGPGQGTRIALVSPTQLPATPVIRRSHTQHGQVVHFDPGLLQS